MGKITFNQWQQKAVFHNPLKGGQLDAQEIEVRVDPLTAHQSVFNTALEDKVSILFPDTDRSYAAQRAQETIKTCFLCEGRWKETTPRYPAELFPDGRLIRGEVVLFPNLFPLSAYHAVVMVGNQHFRDLNDFPPALLYDALSASLDFIVKCNAANPEIAYFTINANYLPPAGASVVHPHLQILGSPLPGTHHRHLLELSREHFDKNGSCYWMDLMETESAEGLRTIGNLGGSRWLTAFSPVGVNEVNAIWTEREHFLQWTEQDIRSMAEGMSRILRAYHDLGCSTFNFSCFSGPLGRSTPEFRCMMRLINRQNMMPHHRTDDYYFQKLLRNEIIVRRPEALATLFRGYLA
jgi:UDPglucose--hexose-1-phosphate uridylyltransferase